MSHGIPFGASIYLLFFAQNLPGLWQHIMLPYRSWMNSVGVVISVLGFALVFWARAVLGGNWSGSVTVKVEHELICTGPYRWVRHPIYTGLILAMIGTAITLDRWRGVVAVILLWIAFTFKRLKEELFMRQTFGDQYVEYSKNTGAIIPLFLRR
jgi:protein-S-isoprenylcysteine O-methyltransferase Ste14